MHVSLTRNNAISVAGGNTPYSTNGEDAFSPTGDWPMRTVAANRGREGTLYIDFFLETGCCRSVL